MLARTRTARFFAISVLGALLLPTTASAALDVTRDATTGGLNVVASGDVTERVTLDRGGDGSLRVADATAAVTSSDAACTPDAATGTVSCATTSGMAVTVALGGGADEFDSRSATGIVLRVDAGSGADRLRVGSSGMTTATGTDGLDTYDLSHADASVRVRYETAARRVVARCGGCAGAWAVTLPVSPKAVLLGTGSDDLDLRAWTVRGLTSWTLGIGADRAIGSKDRRSVFDAGADADLLVSWAPADTLKGGAGSDKVVDFGGSGDVLSGGGDPDIVASLDGGRDTIDGGAGQDMCPSARRPTSSCDTSGRVRNVETTVYMPVASNSLIMTLFGIRL